MQKVKSILVILQGMDTSGKDKVNQKNCFSETIHQESIIRPSKANRRRWLMIFYGVYIKKCREKVISWFSIGLKWIFLIQGSMNGYHVTGGTKDIFYKCRVENLLQYDSDNCGIKFYLHLSHEKQQKKLQRKDRQSEKQWKHNDSD